MVLILEQPAPGALVFSSEYLIGYGSISTTEPLNYVDVIIDQERLSRAIIGLPRIDGTKSTRNIVDRNIQGFSFVARLPECSSRICTMRLEVSTQAGTHFHEVPLQLVFQSGDGNKSSQPILLTFEEARIDAKGSLHVRGWTTSDQKILAVEVFLDRDPIGFAKIGQSRADVAEAFPKNPEAINSGFELTTNLPVHQIREQPVTVVVHDGAGNVNSAQKITSLAMDNTIAVSVTSSPLIIMLEEACVDDDGFLNVRGWSVGQVSVEKVLLFVGEVLIGSARHHLPREDVGTAYPDYADSSRAGFFAHLFMRNRNIVGQSLRIVVVATGNIQKMVEGIIVQKS